jgi:hypothetical protein
LSRDISLAVFFFAADTNKGFLGIHARNAVGSTPRGFLGGVLVMLCEYLKQQVKNTLIFAG